MLWTGLAEWGLKYFLILGTEQMTKDSYKITKEDQLNRTTNKIFLRMILGGIIGAIVLSFVAWSYLLMSYKNTSMDPFGVMAIVFAAWIGAVFGALISVFKFKQNPKLQNGAWKMDKPKN